MLHLAIKKLGRFQRPRHRVTGERTQSSDGPGWEYVHVAIDDNSRVAFSCTQKDERAISAMHALIATLRYYRTLGCPSVGSSPTTAPAIALSCLPGQSGSLA